MDALEKHREAMQTDYPGFRFRRVAEQDDGLGAQEVGVWRGSLQAIRTTEHLAELLDDLEHERLVKVHRGGEVRHRNECTARHHHHDWMDGLGAPFPEFQIEIRYSGGARHPVSRVLRPTLAAGPEGHLNADATICPYYAPDGAWSPDGDTVVKYADLVAVWVVKRVVWDGTGRWPGKAHPVIHDPADAARYHLRVTAPAAQCRCGSGVAYNICHRHEDVRLGAEATARFKSQERSFT